MFDFRDVSLRRGDALVLAGVSAHIRAGGCTAFVGRSGAGKSTLLRLLTRLDDPDTGHITFHDRPLPEYDVLDLRRRVQLVAQQPVLLTDSVIDEVRAGRPQLDDRDASALLSRVGLPASFAHRATAGLSGGERQRLCLARSLALEPEVLLLDEPTAALDAASATAIENTLRDQVQQGRTVVLVSHNTDQVRRIADLVTVLDHGRVIVTGAPDAIHYPEAAS